MTGRADRACFHCGLEIPPGLDLCVRIEGVAQPMCCNGCRAVAQLIVDQGLLDYYRRRDVEAPRAAERPEDHLAELRLYDDPVFRREFVVDAGARHTATLSVEGLRCPACAWLVERHLLGQSGVVSAYVNLSTSRARVEWQGDAARPSDLIDAIDRLGYRARPFEADEHEAQDQRTERAALRRLGVAGLGMAQVMTFAIALYAGSFSGMEPEYRSLLRGVSLVVAAIVLVYAGAPFFRGALRDLRAKRPGMDVPIAIALAGAFAASVHSMATGSGDVYFDSICMFTFFLGLARYLELRIRLRSSRHLRALAGRMPRAARRMEGGKATWVPPRALRVGDVVLVEPGEDVPADGRVLRGESAVSEALLTGEQAPVVKLRDDSVLGGSQNVDGELYIEVQSVGARSALSTILSLLDRASAEKPQLLLTADRLASSFVAGVLLSAVAVFAYWSAHSPADAVWITLSVLVITCPCALSLATPAALAAATNGLARLGFLVTRGHVLETLARVDHVVFDKTGTLTTSTPQLVAVQPLRAGSAVEWIAVARALERHSHHPIAHAIRAPALANEPEIAAAVLALEGRVGEARVVPNHGVLGEIDGVAYRLGRPGWAADLHAAPDANADAPAPDSDVRARAPKAAWILLAGPAGPLCWFGLSAELRADAAQTVERLRAAGLTASLLSGDPAAEEVARIGGALGIEDITSGASPAHKVEVARSLQAGGAIVAAVGDGQNDAPLLGGAHVSVAIAGGSDLARVSADAVLLGERLAPLAAAIAHARFTRRVIRQNVGWALGYNLLALPLAAAGYVPPYLAAAGMSLSSLLVVANALRLAEVRDPR